MSQSTLQNAALTPSDALSALVSLVTAIQNLDLLQSMEKIVFEKRNFPHDLKVFGMHVKSFPNGIGEAFDSLIERMPTTPIRSYFGISEMATNGDILYYAAAEETFDGEARQYGFDIYIVKQGEYLTVTVNDWRKKTACIKDVFEAMLDDVRIDKENPCIEWYKNDDEMVCMVRMNAKT